MTNLNLTGNELTALAELCIVARVTKDDLTKAEIERLAERLVMVGGRLSKVEWEVVHDRLRGGAS